MKNNAERSAAILNCLKDVKQLTNTPEPVQVPLSKVFTKHKVGNELLGVLKQMEILKFVQSDGKGRGAYQWNYGAGTVDSTLANNVYEQAKKYARNRPSKKQRTLNPKPAISVVEKELVVTPKATAKKAVSKDKVEFTDKMGVIFGYKQLEYIGVMKRDLTTTVVIDGNLHIENVRVVKFNIEGSNIAVTFYNDLGDPLTEPAAKIAELRMTNKVLGLKEHGGDTTSSILMMNCIAVSDPYNIN